MEQKDMMRQMIEFNKTTFDNGFNTMVMLQDQAEKMADTVLEQATWLPKEGKKMIDEWVSACKQGREGIKNAVDESFRKASTLFDQFPKSE